MGFMNKTLSPPHIDTWTLRCKHCAHTWVSRIPPEAHASFCPKCRTWKWNADAQYLTEREQARIAKFVKTGKHAKKK